ncbi:MAG: hypothetical protein MUC96_20175 [Myxococcaceae bacterium]|jgi:hypothetical protein|nr:hypothetical protein [Myxococcaceae bacterium]
MRPALLAVAVIGVSLSAQAGILSGLAKLGKAGKVASKGVKLSRGAKLARLAGGVSTVVVAERAAASLGGVAVESAGYLARSSSGELVMLTKAANTPMVVDDVAKAASHLGPKPTMVIDPSVAASPDALKALPAETELFVADGARKVPVRRVEKDGLVEFVVDQGGNAVDLADYAADLTADDDSESSSSDESVGGLVFGGVLLAAYVGWKVLRARAA